MEIFAPKRILAIHDLSGFGHTSLLAVIPILNRLGIRVCALPTAYLSANTDYPDPLWVDMSPHWEATLLHWKRLGLRFDAISSGFLASPEQAGRLATVIQELRSESTLTLVDPVMADNGRLYSCFDGRMVKAMRALVLLADVITPNFTELALLAGADPAPNADLSSILDWCRSVARDGPGQIVCSSVPGADGNPCEAVLYSRNSDSLSRFPFTPYSGAHPGAGDCFAAFLLAGIVNGYSVPCSVRASVEIMSCAIAWGISEGADWREGIPLERLLQLDLHGYYTNN